MAVASLYLGYLLDHLVEVVLVLTEAIDEVAKEEEENRHGGTMDDGAEAAPGHEQPIEAVGVGEKLEEGQALVLLLGLHCSSLRVPRVRHRFAGNPDWSIPSAYSTRQPRPRLRGREGEMVSRRQEM